MDSSSAFSELANRETADGCQEDIVTDLPPKKPGSKAQGRKRTKSGCLTCRQRRIKCGEEKPTCQNCAKSKRLCEGYNQRVVFKDPLSSVRPFASSRSASQSTSHGNKSQQSNTTVTILPIAPRPSARTTSHAESAAIQSSYPRAPPQPVDRQLPVFPAGNANTVEQSESGTSNDIQYFDHRIDDIDRSHVPNSERVSSSARPTHYDFNSLAKQETGEKEIVPAQENQLDWPAALTSGPQQFIPELLQHSHRSFPAIAPSIDKPYSSNQDWKNVAPTTFARPQLRVEQDGTTQQSALETDNHRWLDISQPPPKDQQEQTRISTSTTTQFPGEAPFYSDDFDMTDDEDDPFDVIDDDMNMEEESTATKWRENLHDDQRRRSDLSVVVALQAGQDNLRMRSFVDFIDRPDMLASYAPSIQSSPLRDPMTARIFCHFINATAPMMSMFERHPANPSLIFQGQTVPKSQQHIWTYTFPTLALRNTALLHAMLALACLHIAQLQKAPATTSWKHYSISLRRIGKALNSPSKRAEPATLAAALLLAFYECWGADHQKWTNHLLGAKHLIYQIDFAGISKYLKKKKQQQRQDERTLLQYHVQQQSGNHNFLEDRARLQNHVDDIDENIVGMLMGRRLRYDEYGQVLEDLGADDGSDKFYSEKDLEAYEIQRDLFWWYCKQDMFQSMLGGGKLFMSYHVWGRCPPRAPVGRLNATYGTYDHLVLLMGRVCDFAARDRKRKQATAKANGGWRPPGPHPPPPSGAPAAGGVPANQTPQPPPRMPQTPSFSGMLPISGQAQLPMGFEEYQESSPQSTSSDELDLEAQRIEAEEEWQEIRNMFSVLEDHFGDDFQALGPEFSAPIQTPFGPALQYRTYGIAGIWLTYYMGLIFCHRSHPAMPPVAMMAAGFAARQTGFMANQIGRIAAGLAPDCSMADQISPGVGAGLVESTMSLFIAGVQYQDPTQRIWTISRLRDIARLTGWQTALAILTGCEISWIKAFEAGRGPPYARTTGEPATSDIRDTGLRMTRDTHNRVPENRLVVKSTDRAYYALGVIAFEDDFGKLELAEEGEEHVEGIEDEEREEDQAGQET